MTITVKQPSKELMEMISAAASSLMAFGELWDTIKKKGGSEGFQETELQEMLRPLLKDRLGMSKDRIYYLFHKEEKAEANKQAYNNRINPKIDQKKEPEQKNDWSEEVEDIFDKKPMVPVKDSTQFYAEQKEEEDPKDTEIAFMKEQVAQLEDALKKMEMFKPAEVIVPIPEVKDEAQIFEWLGKRHNDVSIFWFPNYGRELFKSRILTQLENSGIKSFKRLYFEV